MNGDDLTNNNPLASRVSGRIKRTRHPLLLVDAGLPVGRHRFQLIVVDAAGNRSKPAEVTVVISRAAR